MIVRTAIIHSLNRVTVYTFGKKLESAATHETMIYNGIEENIVCYDVIVTNISTKAELVDLMYTTAGLFIMEIVSMKKSEGYDKWQRKAKKSISVKLYPLYS